MKKLIVFISVCLFASSIVAQEAPYWKEVQEFKELDSLQKPPAQPILFIGSSSFTMWKEVNADFPGYTILNRAFGGSSLTDLIFYKKDIIDKYKPKQIVMYCGENDFAASDTVTVPMVMNRFKTLFSYIQSQYKNIPFVYVSMKPSPSRFKLMPKYTEANRLIQTYLKKFKNTVFVDLYHSMLNADGSPRTDIFLEDNLHMNRTGYAIWQKALAPYLKK